LSLANLPPISEALRAAGLDARKRFGQHFLLDLNICRKIVKIAEVYEDDEVLEVGPGPGGLTRALLESGARVTAVEKDPRFIPLLTDLAGAAPGRLRVIEGDALAFDEASELAAGTAIVANLPYNVGSPLLAKWLTGPFRPSSLTLMFQAEVARRIVATPGEGDYGRLGVLAQALADTRIAMALPARAFTPSPKVDSAVVRLTPWADRPGDELIGQLQRVTAAAFGQRRKKLRSSIRTLGGADLCERAGVDPDARAETVSVGGFLALAASAA
jgi:16S rRNA (adenine1518-N6/adenine1519-N6)-dimethyltransferase